MAYSKIDWDKSGTERYANYVALNNAGYDAVKSVFRNAKVILHIANAIMQAGWDGWFSKTSPPPERNSTSSDFPTTPTMSSGTATSTTP